MPGLDQIPRPPVNSFHLLYCTVCGAALGMRAGGGSIADGETDEGIQARIDLHTADHARIDRLGDAIEALQREGES